MTAIVTRKSVLALKVETTEGTPVAPTAAADYIALQDDFAMEPATNSLENAELKSSIGVSKPIQGAEAPTASLSHYLRHSGVEGTAPNYRQLLKALFGSEDVEATQYDTVVGSTTTVINVDVGEGANFLRGQALLIKDATNGYSIRPIESISGDALTLGFAVSVAPGTSVQLGKAVTYYPAQEGHQTISVWHYIGNAGATQMMSGARVTEGTFTFPAGELINANYSLEGIGFYWDPIEIAAADRYLDFTDDAGTFAAVVTAQMYKDPHQLASALQQAMDDVTTTTPTVTYSNTTGKFTIKTTGTVLSLLWNTGANTANTIGDKIGFSVAADDTGVAATTGYTSDNAQSFVSPQTPSYDASDPLVAKNNSFLIGSATDNTCFEASSVELTITDSRAVIASICAVTGVSGSIINQRAAVLTVSALLSQYDADKFRRFRENTSTRAMYAFGTKTGSNFDAGKSGCVYLPQCVITSISVDDADGLAQLNLELAAFVGSTSATIGEVFMSFV